MSRIHPEDPRVTAHVLGELSTTEAAAVEKAAMLNPAVAEAMDETRQVAGVLEAAFGAQELRLDPARREAIRQAGRVPEAEKIVSMKRSRRWGRAAAVTGVAAALVIGAVWIMVQIPAGERGLTYAEEAAKRREVQLHVLLAPAAPPISVGSGAAPGPELPAELLNGGVEAREIAIAEQLALRRMMNENPGAYFQSVEKAARTAEIAELGKLPPLLDNAYLSSRDVPRARVPLVSGSASFPMVERFVRGEGSRPPVNAVRVEEIINHIGYEDAGDAELDGVRLGAELVRCPWNNETLLLGILLRNESGEPLPPSANLELDLKPDMVRSFRLLGYAPRKSGEDGFAPVPQTLGPGESNYVLYELHPGRQAVFAEHWVMLRAGLVLDGAAPAADRRALISPVSSPPRDWSGASGNFQAASVLAAYGMLLRESPYCDGLTPAGLRALAEEAMKKVPGEDLDRREALQLVLDSVPLL